MARRCAPSPNPAGSSPNWPALQAGGLLSIFRRHSRREERSKRHRVAGTRGRHQSPARRGIATRRLHDTGRRDVLPDGCDQAAITVAKIRGATTLWAPGSDFAYGLVGLFGERVPVRNSVGPGDATRSIVFVERLDPKIDRAWIAFQRTRLHNTGLQQFEGDRQLVDAGPAQQSAHANKAN